MFHALLLTLAVSFGETSVQCAVDTGSAITVLSRSQAERVASKQALPFAAPLQGVGGQTISAALYSIPKVATEDLTWTGVTVAVLPDDTLGTTPCLLGMDLLGRQPVVFDWHARRVREFGAPTILFASGAPESLAVRHVTIAPDAAPEPAPDSVPAPTAELPFTAPANHPTDIAVDRALDGLPG
jgi:hypothetical protein